ncbi:UDP-Gal:alpha-D-GlcNAc-diphosphoundecaprenol beta-1,3-galactosyltransferase [compost metagenome]
MKNEVVVLIPHYNDLEGLKKSLNSIAQEEKVDVLIVDDGSGDSNRFSEDEIRKSFKAKGEIIFLYFEENKGITEALNYGLEYIKTKDYVYIARLDTGDVCLGERFKIQSDFLNENQDIKLVGSHVIVKDTNGTFLFKIDVPTESKKIKQRMFVSSSTVIHPSIMFRAEIVKFVGNYPNEYDAAEDYAFYFKVLKEFKIANMNLYLLEKELNPQSISIKKRRIQAYSRLRIIRDNFYFGFYPIYGLTRNGILYLMPNGLLKQIKRLIFK